MTHVSSPSNSPVSESSDQTAHLLAILARHPGGLSTKELHRAFPCGRRPTTSPWQPALERLRRRGWITRGPDRRLSLSSHVRLVSGTIAFNRAGNAFVEDPRLDTSIFIPGTATGAALEGDRVLVRLDKAAAKNGRSGKRLPGGKVLAVLERARTRLTGILRHVDGTTVLVPTDRRLRHHPRVLSATPSAIGLRVEAELVENNASNATAPDARIVRILGPETDARTDTELVLAEYALPAAFPADVLEAAEGLRLPESHRKNRLDLRDQFVLTIDPTTSRDFDDALALRRLDASTWELWVHIADVTHFVTPDSVLDREARERGNSTYLADRVVPMLPERLSNDLCSLKPKADRLAFSARLRLNDDGDLLDSEFVETIIRSKRRLTYAQAQAALEGSPRQARERSGMDAHTVDTVRRLGRLAERLRRKRTGEGALVWDVDETTVSLGADGRIAACETDTDHLAHQLVEECMLVANEAACRTLAEAGLEQLHRSHATPETGRLNETAACLAAGGIEPGSLTPKGALAHMLREVSTREDGFAWTAILLRALPKASYTVHEQGHFGLAKEYYAHFTSPIRRYADVITHRLLKACLRQDGSQPRDIDLPQLAAHCSQREIRSQRAERHLLDIKWLRRLEEDVRAEGGKRTFEGRIVGVYPKGRQVYLPDYRAMGWLDGRGDRQTPGTGEAVHVVVTRIDLTRGDLDVALS